MNTLSIFRRAAPNLLLLSTCLTVTTAGAIWAFFACNAIQFQGIMETPVLSRESPIVQAQQAENSGAGEQRTLRNETLKIRPAIKKPRGSHIKEEVDRKERISPEPFTDPEPPVQRKARRALV